MKREASERGISFQELWRSVFVDPEESIAYALEKLEKNGLIEKSREGFITPRFKIEVGSTSIKLDDEFKITDGWREYL